MLPLTEVFTTIAGPRSFRNEQEYLTHLQQMRMGMLQQGNVNYYNKLTEKEKQEVKKESNKKILLLTKIRGINK